MSHVVRVISKTRLAKLFGVALGLETGVVFVRKIITALHREETLQIRMNYAQNALVQKAKHRKISSDAQRRQIKIK